MTLARNAGLIALAAVVATQADPAWSAAAAAAGLAFAAAGWALSRRETPADPDGEPQRLPIGAPAPSFELPAIEGQAVSLQSLLGQGKPTMLVFSDPQCGPCQALAPDVAEWQRLHSDELTIAVIERRNGSLPGRDEHGRRTVLLQDGSEIADAYGARGTPTAVMVGADGRVASAVAGGSAGIEALMAASVSHFKPHPVEEEGGSAWTVPVRLGGPLVRRELLARGAATAAAGSVLTSPIRAIGLGRGGAPPTCERHRDCPGRSICQAGRCRCPSLYPVRCDGDCVSTDFDDQRCGGCNKPPCPEGTTCAGGNCITGNSTACGDCGRGRICCDDGGLGGGRCVFPTINHVDCSGCDVNCGGCGIQCGPGQLCCGGRCVDPNHDPNYCGGCIDGRRCRPNQVCHAGQCRDECPSPLRQCGRTCGNPRTQTCCGQRDLIEKDDIANGFVKCCGRRAVQVSSDVENCGSCGCNCVGRDDCTCVNGKCHCPGPLDGSCFFSP